MPNAAHDPAAIESKARASWLCPAIAWGSQILVATALRGVRGLAPLLLLLAIGQFVLIVIGLYLSAKVLALGRDVVPPPSWRAAVAGLVLSAGTILLIMADPVVVLIHGVSPS